MHKKTSKSEFTSLFRDAALKTKADSYLEKSMEDLQILDTQGVKTVALRELSLWLNQRAH